MARARPRAELAGWQQVLSLLLLAAGRRVSGKAEFLPLPLLKNAGSLRVMSQCGHGGEETRAPMQVTAGLKRGWLDRCEHQFPCPLPARG